MDHCIICPTSDLRKFAVQSNYHLALAHMVEKSSEYRNFYRERSNYGDTVILDNSSYEVGDGVYTPLDLVRIAKEIGATEIMAPELFRSGSTTATKILEFCKEVENDTNVFGVLHGTTMKEIFDCFKSVYSYVSTIGFSCRLEVDDFYKYVQTFTFLNKSAERSLHRFLVVKEIFRRAEIEGLKISHLNFHLLGLNHVVELLWYSTDTNIAGIRSCDSSCAYLNGCDGISIRKESLLNYSKPVAYVDFGVSAVSKKTENIIYDNIDFIGKLMKFSRRN